jgi:arylamine N-acetyltransferase
MSLRSRARHAMFSEDGIEEYYRRIKCSPIVRDISGLDDHDALRHLEKLQRCHLAWIPFENLSLHYSRSRTISLDLDDAYSKIVKSPGRGGYCMELNLLFISLLRSIGYQVHSCGARVHNGKRFGGWSVTRCNTEQQTKRNRGHQVSVVKIGGSKYVVDVGFGTNCATCPLLLESNGFEAKTIHEESMRAIWKNIEDNTHSQDDEQKMWVVQWRKAPGGEWNDQLCFSELEFRPEDFAVMNFSTSQGPHAYFAQRVICIKMLMESEEMVGRLTVGTDLSRSVRGHREVLETFETETQRLDALKKYFDIDFSQSECEAIQGTVTAIKES